MRSLKKMREAFAFSAPVDPIALGIPHYFQIITHPMDLTTLEYKLAASGPKPKGRADKGKYADKDEVVLDFDRVWNNSVRFNGPDHLVSLAGLELEKAFDKAMRSCPKDEVVSHHGLYSSLLSSSYLTRRRHFHLLSVPTSSPSRARPAGVPAQPVRSASGGLARCQPSCACATSVGLERIRARASSQLGG